MGFGNDDARATWFNPHEGRFATGPKDNKTFYTYIEGVVSGIKFFDDNYNGEESRKFTLTLIDGGEVVKFSAKSSSGYGQQILKKLPNCDFSKPVKINLTYDEATKKSGALLTQNGNQVFQLWTKEKPGDLPQLEKVVFKGKEQWDGTKQNAWLEDYILKHVASKIDSTAKSGGNGPAASEEDGGEVPF